jgi:FtsZ-binding cell division protein ZapB
MLTEREMIDLAHEKEMQDKIAELEAENDALKEQISGHDDAVLAMEGKFENLEDKLKKSLKGQIALSDDNDVLQDKVEKLEAENERLRDLLDPEA